jgi:hypothetical protein
MPKRLSPLDSLSSPSLPDSSAILDDNDNDPTPTATQHNSDTHLSLLVPRQDHDGDSNRPSFSSLYQLGSALYDRARGAVGSTPTGSVAGSETDGMFDGQDSLSKLFMPLTRPC